MSLAEAGAAADRARVRRLAGRGVAPACLTRRGIAGHLAQLQQRIEYDDLRARQTFGRNRLLDARVHREAHRLVERRLRALERYHLGDLGPWRQFGGDLVLGAAEQERAQAAHEALARRGIAVLLDRRTVLADKVLGGAEQPGIGGVRDRPDVSERVLDRRAGQRHRLTAGQRE